MVFRAKQWWTPSGIERQRSAWMAYNFKRCRDLHEWACFWGTHNSLPAIRWMSSAMGRLLSGLLPMNIKVWWSWSVSHMIFIKTLSSTRNGSPGQHPPLSEKALSPGCGGMLSSLYPCTKLDGLNESLFYLEFLQHMSHILIPNSYWRLSWSQQSYGRDPYHVVDAFYQNTTVEDLFNFASSSSKASLLLPKLNQSGEVVFNHLQQICSDDWAGLLSNCSGTTCCFLYSRGVWHSYNLIAFCYSPIIVL